MKVYAIDLSAWHKVAAILAARTQKRANLNGSPSGERFITEQGDPPSEEPTSNDSTPMSEVGEPAEIAPVQFPFRSSMEGLSPSDATG